MFGMGFMEILLIAVIAVIALGPEKLPKAMVEVARFVKKFKSGIEDAKSTLDNELNISEMKEEANKFRAQIEDAKSTVSKPVDLGLNDIIQDDFDDEEPAPKKEKKEEKVPFKTKEKKAKKEQTQVPISEESTEDIQEAQIVESKPKASDKFKVNQSEES